MVIRERIGTGTDVDDSPSFYIGKLLNWSRMTLIVRIGMLSSILLALIFHTREHFWKRPNKIILSFFGLHSLFLAQQLALNISVTHLESPKKRTSVKS